MTGRPLVGAAALALLAAAQALAGDRPALRPTHDVAVVYRIDVPGRSDTARITMTWANHGTKLRVDLPGDSGYGLVDIATEHMLVVVPRHRLVLQSKFDPRLMPGFAIPDDTRMTRAGADMVAGTPCTVWALAGPNGAGTACITEDGLLLRGEGHGNGAQQASGIEAVSVARGPQPASLFDPPPDYRRITGSGQSR